MDIKNYLLIFLRLSLVFFVLFVPLKPNTIKAEASEYHYVITATNPSNGAVNIPQNLQTGATGSACTTISNSNSTICTIMVGLGIGNNNPKTGIGYPIISSDTVNSESISISSPNDSGLSVKLSGSSECGNCGDFYHSFSFNITHTNFPNGVVLMPNTTYTVTLKGGENGLRAYYSASYQKYEAILDSDYSWSFTTGNGPIPSRDPVITSTPIPTSLPTNTITPTPTSNTNQNNSNLASSTTPVNQAKTPKPTVSAKPTTQQNLGEVEGTATASTITSTTPTATTESSLLTKQIVSDPTSDKSLKTKLFFLIALTMLIVFGLFLSRNYWLRKIKFFKRPGTE